MEACDLEPPPRFIPRGAADRVLTCRDPEVLIVGGAGTGKTVALLYKAHAVCLKYPRSRVLLCRKVRASMNTSVLASFENKVLTDSERQWFGPARPAHRNEYVYPNGSVIAIAGLDNPLRIMSTEFDRVFCHEWTEATEEDHEMLTTRIRESNTPYNQMCCDCNPGPAQHWLLKRAERGKMTHLKSYHEDNPYLYDVEKGDWTPKGVTFMRTLEALSTNRRLRLLKGEWCSDEAAIFDHDVLARHLQRCFPPRYRLRMTHKHDGASRDASIRAHRSEDVIATKKPLPENSQDWQNHLLWWGELQKDPDTGILRPPQDRVYVLSADISGGNEASNSIIGIADRNTRTKVGEWVSATISPGGLARMMAMLGLWCGGARRVGHLIWEANYPGPYFGRQLAQVLEYPSLFRKEKGADQTFTSSSQSLGWFNNQHSKRDAIEGLRDAYSTDDFHNPSEQSIQEALQYLRYPGGTIGPGHLMEESRDAQQTHGDRVIADMLLVIGMSIDLPTPKNLANPTGLWTPERLQRLEERREFNEMDEPDDGEIRY